MKNAAYAFVGVIAFALVSLGVASAANHDGLPGVIEKLEEIKVVLMGIPTTTPAFPGEIDVNIVSPDPIDVKVVDGGTQDSYKVIALSPDAIVPDGTTYEVETAGWRTITIHKSSGGCVWQALWDVDGLQVEFFSLARNADAWTREVIGEKLILTSNSCNLTQRGDEMKVFLTR